ncbi:hypothetical protein [Streptomyces vilmorinianum]|nr:hypothetical protein [Streptomyces vilmorinianum]
MIAQGAVESLGHSIGHRAVPLKLSGEPVTFTPWLCKPSMDLVAW